MKDPEQQDAVAKPPSRRSATVDPKYSDLVALVLCFVTGLCDSSAYNAWACFLGMQTGESLSLPTLFPGHIQGSVSSGANAE